MQPDYRIVVDDKDITDKINKNLKSLTVEDNAGLNSDTLTLVVADPDNTLVIPPQGATIECWMGYAGSTLVYMGKYIADSPEYVIAPNALTLKARAADIYNSTSEKGRKTASWDNTNLGAVVAAVAADMGLSAAVDDALGSLVIDHIDQTDESNLHFVTRLAKLFDATAKPAGGSLVFTRAGSMLSASGLPLPSLTIGRSSLAPGARYSESGRGKYDGVEAVWHDTGTGEKKGYSTGGQTPKKLRGTYSSQEAASSAAAAENSRLQRDRCKFDITLRPGNAAVRAEMVIVTDATFMKPELIGTWTVRKATQTITRKGFETSAEMTKVTKA